MPKDENKLVLPAMVKSDLAKVIEYLNDEEAKHYEENDRPADHIWHSVVRLNHFLIKKVK